MERVCYRIALNSNNIIEYSHSNNINLNSAGKPALDLDTIVFL